MSDSPTEPIDRQQVGWPAWPLPYTARELIEELDAYLPGIIMPESRSDFADPEAFTKYALYQHARRSVVEELLDKIRAEETRRKDAEEQRHGPV